jgi:hypothetical protein
MPNAVPPPAIEPETPPARESRTTEAGAPPRASKPPPSPPTIVQAIDHVGEIVFIALAGWLCSTGHISGELFLGAGLLVLGIQTGIRSVGARARAPGVSGMMALAFVAITAGSLAHRLAIGASVLLVAGASLAGCSGTAVERQALAADALAKTMNRVTRPALVEAYRLECGRAIRASCPAPPCDRAVVMAAFETCDRTWRAVFGAYEGVARAHGVYRLALERCRASGAASCPPDVARAAGDLLAAGTGYRCEVRRVGRADLDPLPGELACPDRADAGGLADGR